RYPIVPSAGGFLLRHQRIVKRFGAQKCRTVSEPLPILLEGRTFFDRSEHQPEADLRTDVEIGRGKALADEIWAPPHRVFQRLQDETDIAVTHHALAVRRHDEAEHLVAHRRLEWAR